MVVYLYIVMGDLNVKQTLLILTQWEAQQESLHCL